MSSFNKVGGRYGMHSGSAKFKNLQVDQNMWVNGNSIGPVSPGQTWFVNSAVNASGTGASWDLAFKSIAEAVDVAGANGDTIYVAPGDYEISEAIDITTNNLKIIGPNKSCNDYSALVYNDDAFNIFEIDANNISIIGLGIATADDAGVGVAIGGTTSSYKVYIANCRFDGWDKGTYAITTDDTQDCPDLTVEDCLFRSWTTGCIYANSTRSMYRNNVFFVSTDTMGIQYVPTTGSRPDGIIMDNKFIGLANASTTAIAMTGTPTAGNLIIASNLLAGSWDVTIEAESTDAGVENYEGSTTGGSLIDCNSSA